MSRGIVTCFRRICFLSAEREFQTVQGLYMVGDAHHRYICIVTLSNADGTAADRSHTVRQAALRPSSYPVQRFVMKRLVVPLLLALLLTGCVAVPIDEAYPVQSSVHVYSEPYPVYQVYEVPRPIYGPPVYVRPPVYGPGGPGYRYRGQERHPGYGYRGNGPHSHHHSGPHTENRAHHPGPYSGPQPAPQGEAQPRRGRGAASGLGVPGNRPPAMEGHGGRGGLRQ